MIKTKLYWREISSDGLVREPDELGPHYSPESLNDLDGFDTEEEALARLNDLMEQYKHEIPYSLILVKMYLTQ